MIIKRQKKFSNGASRAALKKLKNEYAIKKLLQEYPSREKYYKSLPYNTLLSRARFNTQIAGPINNINTKINEKAALKNMVKELNSNPKIVDVGLFEEPKSSFLPRLKRFFHSK